MNLLEWNALLHKSWDAATATYKAGMSTANNGTAAEVQAKQKAAARQLYKNPRHADHCGTGLQTLLGSRAVATIVEGKVTELEVYCACFPGMCRGGEVINGKTACGMICKLVQAEKGEA